MAATLVAETLSGGTNLENEMSGTHMNKHCLFKQALFI
jgi:hypothetical protein